MKIQHRFPIHRPLLKPIAALALWFLATGPLLGDVTVEQEDEGGNVTINYRLTLTAKAETSPAFKYRFTVLPHEQIQGNAITHYLRSQGEGSLTRPWETARERFGEEVYDWYANETPTKDVPVEDLRTASGYFDGYIKNHLDRASRCRDVDWGLGIADLRGDEAISFLLPSIQQTRSMARALQLQNRLAVIDGRYEDSVELLRINFQLGQDVAKLPLLVSALVGIAEVGMAHEGSLQLIAADGSPNLYWAFADLPDPIINLRQAFRVEASMPRRFLTELDGVESAQLPPEEWARRLSSVVERLLEVSTMYTDQAGEDQKQFADWLKLASGMVIYPAARQRLIDSGMDEAAVDKMCVAQVVLVDTANQIDRYSNEIEKINCLSYPRARVMIAKFENRLRAEANRSNPGAVVMSLLAPATAQVKSAMLRVQAQMRALMAIESIRHHVATEGSLPQSLDELMLPVRENPLTEKPFLYVVEQVDGKSIAHLSIDGLIYPRQYKYTLEFIK